MVNRGFVCAGEDFISNRWTLEKFQKILDWGFNTILIPIWWAKIERSLSDYGSYGGYRQDRIENIKAGVDLAKQAGLNVIISSRICYDPSLFQNWWTDWANMPTHDYVNTTERGRNRYRDYLKYLAQQFSDCQISVWHFPYHRQSPSVEAQNLFYNATLPLLIDSVQEVNFNRVIVSPIHQGTESSLDFSEVMPSYGDNVILGFGHTIPQKVCQGSEWDGTADFINERLGRVETYCQLHGCDAFSVEFAPLQWNGQGLSLSRLNALKLSLDRMDDKQYGFAYHRISLTNRSGDNILSKVTDPIEVNSSILQVLKGYEVVVPPEPPQEDNRFLLLSFLGLMLLALVWISSSASWRRFE